MTTFAPDTGLVRAVAVLVSETSLAVDMADGRTISVPLAWYPRLLHATAAERADWRLVGNGLGIHWPGIEEDISVESLLSGRQSQERAESLQRWLASRKN